MKRFSLILLVLSGIPVAVSAQGVSFLDYNPDAHALGVAGASAVDDATAFSVWNNAATTAFSEDKFSAGASFALWQPSFSNVRQAAVAGYGVISERLSINAGFRYDVYQPYDTADENGIYTGTFTPSGMQGTIGASFLAIPSLAVSVSASFVHSDIGGPKAANTFCFDIGLLYKYRTFRAALTAANLGASFNYGGASSYSLPSRVDLGLGYGIGYGHGRHTLDINAQGSYLLMTGGMRAAAGLRYCFNGLVHVSAGYNCGLSESLPNFASLGAGVSFWGVGLDFAYLMASAGTPMAGTMVVNLSYAF